MTIRWFALLCTGCALLVAGGVAKAEPAQARLDRVVLLRSDRGVSLVLELTAEPEKAMLESAAGAVLAIQIGPVAERVTAHALEVPAGISLIESVHVEDVTVADAPYVRARVTTTLPTRTNLRVVGRRVYVDVAPVGLSPALDAARAAHGIRREGAGRPPSGQRSGPEPRRYQETVGPIVERFEELGPFLLSAAKSQDPQVLEALRTPLNEVRDSLTRIEPPAVARPAHTLLVSAVMMATRALAPGFSGDRGAQAHGAIATLAAAKEQLSGRVEP